MNLAISAEERVKEMDHRSKEGLDYQGLRLPAHYWQPVKLKFWVTVPPGPTTNWPVLKETGRLEGLQSGEPGFELKLMGTKA